MLEDHVQGAVSQHACHPERILSVAPKWKKTYFFQIERESPQVERARVNFFFSIQAVA